MLHTFLISEINTGSGSSRLMNTVEVVRRVPASRSRGTSGSRDIQSQVSGVLLQDNNRIEIIPHERLQSDWLLNRQRQPIRRLNTQNHHNPTFPQQQEIQVIDLRGNNANNRRNINRVRVINDPRLVRRLLAGNNGGNSFRRHGNNLSNQGNGLNRQGNGLIRQGNGRSNQGNGLSSPGNSRGRQAQNNLRQPTMVRVPVRSAPTTRQNDNTYFFVNQLPQSRNLNRLTLVNTRRPTPVFAIRSGATHGRTSSSQSHANHGNNHAQTDQASVSVPRVSVAHTPAISSKPQSAQPSGSVTAPKQSLSAVHFPAVVTAGAAATTTTTTTTTAPGIGIVLKPTPAQTNGDHLLYEELVNAFTEALQPPQTVPHTGVQTQAHSHQAVVSPGHVQVPGVASYYHPHTAGSQFHPGIPRMHGPMGMFGNPYGLISPWMMDPASRQEMMFGDTTDPPNPVETTAAAPKPTTPVATTAAATPPQLAQTTAAKIHVQTNIPIQGKQHAPATMAIKYIPGHTSPIPIYETNTGVIPLTTVATALNVHANQPSTQTAAVMETTQTNVRSTEPSVPFVTAAFTVSLNSSSVGLSSALPPRVANVPSLAQPPAKNGNTRPGLVSELKVLFSNSKLDAKVVEAAIQQAVVALGTMPPELELIAKQFGIHNISQPAAPTTIPLQTETFPTLAQLGVTIPEPGKPVPRQSVKELKGSTRGVVIYPPTSPSQTKFLGNHTIIPSEINIVVIEPTYIHGNKSISGKAPFPPSAGTSKTTPKLEVMPTIPPIDVLVPKQPEIYQTIQTVQENQPPSSKTAQSHLKVKSLVDTSSTNGHLPTLEAILVDITNNSKPNNGMTTNIDPLQFVTVAASSGTDKAAHVFHPERLVDNHAVGKSIPVHPNLQMASKSNTISKMTSGAWDQSLFHLVNVSRPSLVGNPSLPNVVNVGSVPLTSAKVKPFLANVESFPVNVEQIVPQQTNSSGVQATVSPPAYVIPADATGALSILKQIRTLNETGLTSNPASIPDINLEIAKRLSNPAVVDALQALLKKLGPQFNKSVTSPAMTSTLSTSPLFNDVTTTLQPSSSTEEFEPP